MASVSDVLLATAQMQEAESKKKEAEEEAKRKAEEAKEKSADQLSDKLNNWLSTLVDKVRPASASASCCHQGILISA